MKRRFPPIVFGIIALAIVTILFLLLFVVKSLEPKGQGWHMNYPLIYYSFLYPVYMPFVAIGSVRSAKMLRVKEERGKALAGLITSGIAFIIGTVMIFVIIFAYPYWPILW